jgi:hypothetical protein
MRLDPDSQQGMRGAQGALDRVGARRSALGARRSEATVTATPSSRAAAMKSGAR